MSVDPIREEALRIALTILGPRPSVRRLVDTAVEIEVFLLGASGAWGGTPSGVATLAHIAREARKAARPVGPTPADGTTDRSA